MLLWMLACASLGEVQGEWQAYLGGLPGCETDDDCVVVAPSCPLECYSGVPVDFEDEADERAAELVDRYRTVLRPCTDECSPRPAAACNDAGRCDTQLATPPAP